MSVYGLSDDAVTDLKIFYEETRPDTQYRNNAFLAMVKKKHPTGQQVAETIKYGYSKAHGPDFPTNFTNSGTGPANGNGGLQKRKQVFLPWYEGSALDRIGAKEQVLSTGEGGIVELIADAIQGTQRECGNDIEMACFQDGAGTMATVSTTATSAAGGANLRANLTNPSDAEKFNVGDRIVSAATAFAGSLDTGVGIVSTVDPDNGFIACTTTTSFIFVANHLLFLEAAKPAANLTVPNWILGQSAWLPLVAPVLGTDSFGGIDRGDAPSQLGGRRIDARNKPLRKAISLGLAKLSVAKEAEPDVIWMNPLTWSQLGDDLQNAKIYEDTAEGTGGAAGVFFDAYKIRGPKGPVKVLASHAVPQDRFFINTMRTWTLYCPGGEPVMMGGKDQDGIIGLIDQNASQVRSWHLSTLGCSFPGANAVVQIA